MSRAVIASQTRDDEHERKVEVRAWPRTARLSAERPTQSLFTTSRLNAHASYALVSATFTLLHRDGLRTDRVFSSREPTSATSPDGFGSMSRLENVTPAVLIGSPRDRSADIGATQWSADGTAAWYRQHPPRGIVVRRTSSQVTRPSSWISGEAGLDNVSHFGMSPNRRFVGLAGEHRGPG